MEYPTAKEGDNKSVLGAGAQKVKLDTPPLDIRFDSQLFYIYHWGFGDAGRIEPERLR